MLNNSYQAEIPINCPDENIKGIFKRLQHYILLRGVKFGGCGGNVRMGEGARPKADIFIVHAMSFIESIIQRLHC